jgi:hypothetical protein
MKATLFHSLARCIKIFILSHSWHCVTTRATYHMNILDFDDNNNALPFHFIATGALTVISSIAAPHHWCE